MIVSYRIGGDNRFTWVSDEWEEFARENGAEHLGSEQVLGRSLFAFISGAETEYIYYLLLDELRTVGRTVNVPFRCDSPALRRFMRLEMSPLPDQAVEFVSSLVREEPRPEVPFLDTGAARTVDAMTICSWCKRVRVGRGWLDLESAVERLDLFRSRRLPQQNHCVCRHCSRYVRRVLDEAASA